MTTARVVVAAVVIALLGFNLTTEAVTSHVVPGGTLGNQSFGGSLGMDFNVNAPIDVSRLGVFDSGSNGLSLPVTARLFNRATGTEVTPAVAFPTGSPGSLEGGSRLLPVGAPTRLPAGFQGTIVAHGYGGAEPNGNAGGGVPVWTTDDGGGLISFVGGGRFNATPGAFPNSGDGGPANRYAAGTFDFAASSVSNVAYEVQPGTVGNQTFGGSLGMDFNVNSPINVTSLGVFDSGQDGLNLGITAHLYSRASQEKLATVVFPVGPSGTLISGSRFQSLTGPVRLPAGFQGTIVAEGYGVGEPNGNGGVSPLGQTTNSLGGALSFVGSGRFGTAGDFPGTADGGPANRYTAGTFQADASGIGGIAYDVATNTAGNQAFGGSLGMDFDVNTPMTITALGVFDDGSDGLNRTLVASIYDRNNPGNPIDSVAFSTGDTGTLIGGHRFLKLAEPIELPAGFQGTIVAQGYGLGEQNGNSGSVPRGQVTDTLGGALTFVGTGRFGDAGAYPGSADGGPANRYVAGTFATDAIGPIEKESGGNIAYIVQEGLAGNQNFGGSLGMDFNVNERQVVVSQLGVFDDGSDGLNQTITAHLYDRNNPSAPLATLVFSPTDPGELVNGSRFKRLETPLILQAGFEGTIVAEGYGPGELLANRGAFAFPNLPLAVDPGNGLLSFVGTSRFGTAGQYPGTPDGGPFDRYAAGTFVFHTIPEPVSASLLLVATGVVLARRSRGRRSC